MKYLATFFAYLYICLFSTGCSFTTAFEEIPVSDISDAQLYAEVNPRVDSIENIHAIIQNRQLSPQQKIKELAKTCSIQDLSILFWYMNFIGNPLQEEVLTLNTAKEIFAAKMSVTQPASLECMEGALLCAYILREKKIQPYILLLHGFNFQSGHAVCVYRTRYGWASVGINNNNYIEPTESLALFKYKLNNRFNRYTRVGANNIVLFAIRTAEEIHPEFVNGEARLILWSNMLSFFQSSWY